MYAIQLQEFAEQMKVIELVGRPGTGKTTLAKKVCEQSDQFVSRAGFFRQEITRSRKFRWLPGFLFESPWLEGYVISKSGELVSGGADEDPVLARILERIIRDVTTYDKLPYRLNLLFRDYAIQRMAANSSSDQVLLLDEGLIHRLATFTLNGLKPESFLDILEMLPLNTVYAYLEVPDDTLRRNLVNRGNTDESLFIGQEVYQQIQDRLSQRPTRFLNLVMPVNVPRASHRLETAATEAYGDGVPAAAS